MTHSQLCLNLTLGLKYNADNDQKRGSAESEAAEVGSEAAENKRKNCNYTKEDSTDKSYLIENLLDIIGGGLPGRRPGMKPPFFLRLLDTSTGLKEIAT